MAEMSFPYGSVNHDRRYKSNDFRAYYAQLISSGVVYSNSNALKVIENVKPDIADGVLSRIDRIVIRNDYKKRSTYAAVLKGAYSAQPAPRALTRNADAYEIAIADVLVAKGAISITQANITDTRLNKELCGIVTGVIEQADTTEIFNQFEAYLNEFKQHYISEIENWTADEETQFTEWTQQQKEDFITWVDSIKDIFDETTAGRMKAEIEKLQTELNAAKTALDTKAPYAWIEEGDFNNMTTPGIYTMDSSSLHYPVWEYGDEGDTNDQNYCGLIVLNSDENYIEQIAIAEGTGDILTRCKSGTNNWTNWQRLAFASEVDELKKSVSDGKTRKHGYKCGISNNCDKYIKNTDRHQYIRRYRYRCKYTERQNSICQRFKSDRYNGRLLRKHSNRYPFINTDRYKPVQHFSRIPYSC